MATVIGSPAELPEMVGKHLGYSDWLDIDQERVNLFADATGDHQWIHIDPEAAKSGPFGTTIAHGYLTLSLISYFLPRIVRVENVSMGVNYGCDKVRFPAPVPSARRFVQAPSSSRSMRSKGPTRPSSGYRSRWRETTGPHAWPTPSAVSSRREAESVERIPAAVPRNAPEPAALTIRSPAAGGRNRPRGKAGYTSPPSERTRRIDSGLASSHRLDRTDQPFCEQTSSRKQGSRSEQVLVAENHQPLSGCLRSSRCARPICGTGERHS